MLVVGGGPAASPEDPVAVELWVCSGAGDERPDEHGAAHLLEHMLFKAPSCGAPDLAAVIEGHGGDINAFTSHDETVIHAVVPRRAAAAATRAILTAALEPAFDPEEVAEETEVVVEEIHESADDPAQRVFREVWTRLYREHPYGHPILGTAPSVRGLGPAGLRAFHRRVYVGHRMRLVVSGPVRPGQVRRWAEPLAQIPAGRRPRRPRRPEPATRPRVQVWRADAHEAHIVMAWAVPAGLTADAVALEAASIVLGHGDASRLTREVRRGAGLATDVRASWLPGRSASTFMVSASGPVRGVAGAVEAMAREVRRLRDEGVTTDELDRARAVLLADRVYGRETVAGQAQAAGGAASLWGTPAAEATHETLVRQLDVPALRRALSRHLVDHTVVCGLVVPKDAPKGLAARVRRVWAGGRPRVRAPRAGREEGPVQAADLAGGLRLRLVQRPDLPMVAGWVVWPGGQLTESARLAGRSVLLARMLTRGTSRRDGELVAEAIDGRAAALDGFAGRSTMGLYFECLTADLDAVLAVARECAAGPRFDPVEVARERGLMLDELRAAMDDLGHWAHQRALAALYGAHPLGRPRMGTAGTVRRLSAPSLTQAWQQVRAAGGPVVGLCGDVDLARARALLAGWTDGARGRPARLPRPQRPPKPAPRRVHSHRERAQVHLVLAYPGIALDDPGLPALDLLLAVLGGQSGRLFMALREREGLVYHVSVSSAETVGAGHVTAYAASSAEKFSRTEQVLRHELARVREAGITSDELERARAHLLGRWASSLQRRSRVAAAVAFDELTGLGCTHLFDLPARLGAVTTEQVRVVARRVFDPRHEVRATVGPRR